MIRANNHRSVIPIRLERDEPTPRAHFVVRIGINLPNESAPRVVVKHSVPHTTQFHLLLTHAAHLQSKDSCFIGCKLMQRAQQVMRITVSMQTAANSRAKPRTLNAAV